MSCHLRKEWSVAPSPATPATQPLIPLAGQRINYLRPQGSRSYSKLSDINMLLRGRGRERAQAEYRALLFQAGLGLTKAVPTDSPTAMMLLEAKP